MAEKKPLVQGPNGGPMLTEMAASDTIPDANIGGATGTGAVVRQASPTINSPVLTAPALGTPASGVLTNCTGLSLTAGVTGILPAANGGTANGFTAFTGPATSTKTFTLPNSSATILTSAAAVTVAQGGTGRTTSTTAYGLIAAGTTATGALQTLPAGTTSQILVGGGTTALPVWTTATGTGAPVRATSPTLVTPDLGTPSNGVLTNCTGLPVGSGVSGLGTGVATFLATPSSANLLAAVTDETGTGALVFATSPTLVTPALGTPSSGTLTNCTGHPHNSTSSLQGGSSGEYYHLTADEYTGTGSGDFVRQSAPSIASPTITGVMTATGQYYSPRNALTDGATIALDWNNGNVQSVTLGGNRTFTFANPVDGGRYMIIVQQDATGSRTATWPGTVSWQGGTAPTLTTGANKYDVITFVYHSSAGKYFGAASLNFT